MPKGKGKNGLDCPQSGRYRYVVMVLATRLLVMLLMLSSTGVLPAVGCLVHADCQEDAKADPTHAGADEERCAGCSPACAVCICCPLRATPAMRMVGVVAAVEPRPQGVVPAEPSRGLAGITAEIFHPPRV